jgi:hypothetical protein
MMLKARNPKDFLDVLVAEVAAARAAKGFEERVRAIKRLSLLDVEYYAAPSGAAEPSFRGRRFSVPPTRIGTHTVTVVTGTEDYRVIRAHGTERLLRSFFSDRQVRRLIQQIVSGDEALRGAVARAPYLNLAWDCGEGPVVVDLFPVEATKHGVMLKRELPKPYLNDPCILIQLCSAAFPEVYPLPLGLFEVRAGGDEYPCVLTARRDTFSAYPDEILVEKMYNAQHGISYRTSRETMQEIESAIVSGEGNPRLLGKILFLVAGLLGVSGGETRAVMLLLKRVLEYMQDVTMDELVAGGKFTGGRAMSAAVFAEVVPELSDSTLFRLVREGQELIRVVDAHGIEVGNVAMHVYREQVKRYKQRPEMDMTLRSILSGMGSLDEKQALMSLVFEEVS